MSIIIECEQGSPEWFAARLGIPTASSFDKIITPTGKKSTQAEGYMNRLLAEWLIGKPAESEANEWMERGREMEADARRHYEFHKDATVQTVGLIYRDDRRLVSCSPDGLIADDGGLELKCPSPWTHVKYLLADEIPAEYIPQVQGGMYVTGRQWWDFESFHPDLEPLIVRVERDESYIKTMDGLIEDFISDMLAKRTKLMRRAA